MIGIGFCAVGCYFAAMGLIARSPDNALINYVVLAALPFLLGLAMASIGWRGVKDARRDSSGSSPQ
jgi:hypothetical protein